MVLGVHSLASLACSGGHRPHPNQTPWCRLLCACPSQAHSPEGRLSGEPALVALYMPRLLCARPTALCQPQQLCACPGCPVPGPLLCGSPSSSVHAPAALCQPLPAHSPGSRLPTCTRHLRSRQLRAPAEPFPAPSSITRFLQTASETRFCVGKKAEKRGVGPGGSAHHVQSGVQALWQEVLELSSPCSRRTQDSHTLHVQSGCGRQTLV